MFAVTLLSSCATIMVVQLFPVAPLLHHYPNQLCCEPTRVLIVVKTYPSHKPLRQAIRETVASKSVTSALPWRVLFYMGHTEDKKMSTFLRKETRKGDVLIAPYSAESSNIIPIFIEAARWIVENCSPRLEYVVHINDTTFPDLLGLHEYIGKLDETDRYFHCDDQHFVPVRRRPGDRFYVPETLYRDAFLPAHCEPDTFLVKSGYLKALVLASEVIPQYPLFGPYVTGHLTVLARLGHIDISKRMELVSVHPDWDSCALFVSGLVNASLWKQYWFNRLLEHRHVTNVTAILARKMLTST
ncbi:N-acetyllactosaminide beta-1,3-N-acetylglucosaminyltransferase 3-like [Ixodes scapularis]|uniref:N-acetyllactosaminide beta-1,3-N-acetylglucosaminyltransferase 3-like n=1 Tax=Ixodes scapularis TaxID=6945 RepID=UPI001A9F0858|nr:N-acetyllactosaminide beta-1,3-N-acetylglucosaminyltransferase 3-like [Ixodes scapularis]